MHQKKYTNMVLPFLIFLILSVFGCDLNGSNNDDDLGDIAKYNLVGLCEDGSYDLERSQYLTSNMFKILGMLDEYISRFSYYTGLPYPDHVETFYPSETFLADYFEDLVLQFENEALFSFDYTRETGDQGHHSFISTNLSELINSYYFKPDGFTATLDRNIFCNASEENLLSYLESAYMRYGDQGYDGFKDNYISMANAPYKIVTIGLLLHSLGCDNVTVYKNSGGVPTGYHVFFQPTDFIGTRLGIERTQSEEELSQDYTGILYDAVKCRFRAKPATHSGSNLPLIPG